MLEARPIPHYIYVLLRLLPWWNVFLTDISRTRIANVTVPISPRSLFLACFLLLIRKFCSDLSTSQQVVGWLPTCIAVNRSTSSFCGNDFFQFTSSGRWSTSSSSFCHFSLPDKAIHLSSSDLLLLMSSFLVLFLRSISVVHQWTQRPF